jgi:hypothetical protein
MQNELAELNPKKQKYAQELAKGNCSKREALLRAGYAESVARRPACVETADFKTAFQAVMRKKIAPSAIARVVSQGMKATKTHYAAQNGVITDSRESVDYRERREAAHLASLMTGYYEPHQSVDVTQRYDNETLRRLTQISDKLLQDVDYAERKTLRASSVNMIVDVTENDSEDTDSENQSAVADSQPVDATYIDDAAQTTESAGVLQTESTNTTQGEEK